MVGKGSEAAAVSEQAPHSTPSPSQALHLVEGNKASEGPCEAGKRYTVGAQYQKEMTVVAHICPPLSLVLALPS